MKSALTYLVECQLKREIHRGACAWLRFNPQPTVVPVDDVVDNRHAYSSAFVFFIGVQPLEWAEYLLCKVGVKANPIVL